MTSCCDRCADDEIARLVRAGDRHALDRITRCYGGRLLAVGQRVCGDPDSARDAVQDALVRAGEHLAQFRGDGSVESWVARMVANACVTRHRGRKNQPAWNQELRAETVAARASTPVDCAARAELARHLGAVLAELDTTDRAVLLLTQVDGWSAADVARALGSTSDAIRARLSRLRRRLRAELAELWRDWS